MNGDGEGGPDETCPRCEAVEWALAKQGDCETPDWRCGGCGLWYMDFMGEFLGKNGWPPERAEGLQVFPRHGLPDLPQGRYFTHEEAFAHGQARFWPEKNLDRVREEWTWITCWCGVKFDSREVHWARKCHGCYCKTLVQGGWTAEDTGRRNVRRWASRNTGR